METIKHELSLEQESVLSKDPNTLKFRIGDADLDSTAAGVWVCVCVCVCVVQGSCGGCKLAGCVTDRALFR